MSSQNAPTVRQAQVAIKAGRRKEARALLQRAIRQDEGDHQAWAWLASVTPSAKTSLGYARRAARLDPEDPLVQKVLAWAEHRYQAAVAEQAAAQPRAHAPIKAGFKGWQPRLAKLILALFMFCIVLGVAAFAWERLGKNETAAPAEKLAAAIRPTSQAAITNEAVLPAEASATPEQPTATLTASQQSLRAKNVAGAGDPNQQSTPRPTWTATPEATPTPSATPTFMPTFVSPGSSEAASRPSGVGPSERWIDVDLDTQTLNAFEGDTLVFSSLISSGTWQHPTVTGQFRIWLRYASQTMDGRRLGYDYYLENVPYVMYFYQDYALHGTYWHNNFGTPMSHGCVNMKTTDAEWIFNWSTIGTVVNVHY